ncbi:FHA domain-containing protein [Rhodovulum sp.]|uniref:FHA domain-containing protein n=1 Tax=Rhodovulum sp. TaxID=34009 RepID=UPI00257DFECF|nr:FHA domain-containing protein [Rhodovulum sp.]
MKFLRRKNGDKPHADEFNDYVEPFPPLRRGTPEAPGAEPQATPRGAARAMPRTLQPQSRDPDAFRQRLGELDVASGEDIDDAFYDDDPDHPAADYAPTPGWPGSERPAPQEQFQALSATATGQPGGARPVLFPGDDRGAAPHGHQMAPDHATFSEGERQRPPPASARAGLPGSPDVQPPRPAAPAAEYRPDIAHGRAPDEGAAFEAPPPAAGRAGGGANRARTRLLGFGHAGDPVADPFAQDAGAGPSTGAVPGFPVGWLVVVDGPGRGAHFTLFAGVSQIGRGADQTVRLDFGDSSISRSGHALLAYDDEQGQFFLGSGGKVNIVRLNGQPLLSTEEMSDGDTIRIGETTLRFVAFCGPGFTWSTDRRDAEHG